MLHFASIVTICGVTACPVALAGHLAIGRADRTSSRYLGVLLQLSIFLAEPALRRLWIRK